MLRHIRVQAPAPVFQEPMKHERPALIGINISPLAMGLRERHRLSILRYNRAQLSDGFTRRMCSSTDI